MTRAAVPAAAGASAVPLPVGFGVVLDRRTRVHGDLVVGGSPRRALALTSEGSQRLLRLAAGATVADATDGLLARRMLDTGIAHPRPPTRDDGTLGDPVVVVPARGRPEHLDRCLAALGSDLAVVVVDDGSPDAAAVASVATRHGARLVRREATGGPAAARATGMAAVDADVVAFVDSDATVDAAALHSLARHLADPTVAAVAPRIRPAVAHGGVLGRFAAARSPLDAGAQSSRVCPDAAVRYVPTTVLVVRRTALDGVGGFDPALRHGEDVDLVWRLADAGWTVRYDATVTAAHAEPETWWTWLDRRRRYGTSAGPLARRHGNRLSHLPLHLAPVVTLVAAVATAPGVVAALHVVTVGRSLWRVRRRPGLWREAAASAGTAPLATAVALSRWATVVAGPGLVAGLAPRRTRRGALVVLTIAPLAEWLRRRPRLDPLRWTVACIADDVAYGVGVWQGCVRARTVDPLLPRRQTRRR